VAGKARSPIAPGVPTFAEAGVPNFDASFCFGLAAPRGTPPAIVAKFPHDAGAIVNNEEFKTRYLRNLDFEAVGDTPEQFAAFLKTGPALGAQKVKVSGARLD
jgi:tripartite-type tricarboxylate transporter receptor subunit TctC